MPSEIDIYRSANLLVDQHGEDAPIFTAQQTDKCLEAGDLDGKEKATGKVCLDDGKSGQMAFQARPDLQNRAIGWLRKVCSSLGGGTVLRFP